MISIAGVLQRERALIAAAAQKVLEPAGLPEAVPQLHGTDAPPRTGPGGAF